MIGLWMLEGIAVGLLLWGGAAAGEQLLRAHGLPRRGVWVVAMVGSVVIPLRGLVSGSRPPSFGAADGAAGEASGVTEGFAAHAVPLATFPWVDVVLLAGWALGSLVALGFLARSAIELRRLSRNWKRGKLFGQPVRIAAGPAAAGPGVAGFLEPRIVVPAWLFELDRTSRKMLLDHEQEHLWAGDPRLVLAGALAVALFPWNPGLWLQNSRLREAIELDCDARVLRRKADRRCYGRLLLCAAQRVGLSHEAVISLPVSGPPLERRIRGLAGAEPRLTLPHIAALSCLVVSSGLGIGLLPDSPPAPLAAVRSAFSTPPELSSEAVPPRAAGDLAPVLLNRHQTPRILARAYPPRLWAAGIGGTVAAWVYVGGGGDVVWTEIIDGSGHAELDEAAARALREFRFRPARVGGRVAGAWTAQHLTFVVGPPPASADPPDDHESAMPARLAIWSTPGTAGSQFGSSYR